MTASTPTLGTNELITALQVLIAIAEERTTYDSRWREQTDFTALAAKLLMADELAMGEPATIPDPLRVERVEEELDKLFSAAHILSRVYTSLADD